jgi:hypothetical protein
MTALKIRPQMKQEARPLIIKGRASLSLKFARRAPSIQGK